MDKHLPSLIIIIIIILPKNHFRNILFTFNRVFQASISLITILESSLLIEPPNSSNFQVNSFFKNDFPINVGTWVDHASSSLPFKLESGFVNGTESEKAIYHHG